MDLTNNREARILAAQVLRETTAPGRHIAFAALALARAGDEHRAEELLQQLNKQPQPGTAMNNILLPSIRAALALNRRNAAAAVEELQRAVPYDLGQDSSGLTLYYRGLAYLELKDGKEAAAQFQKILDNRGIVDVDVYWPLAHLGLARAYVAQQDALRARAAYQDFLALWKDADSDTPLLKQAKAEYAKLQ